MLRQFACCWRRRSFVARCAAAPRCVHKLASYAYSSYYILAPCKQIRGEN